MTQLTPFQFQDHEVRTVMVNGEPWFIAKDVCDILGLSNITESIKRLSDREFITTEVTDASGRTQQMIVIRESGLYKLVMKSRKPIAIEFQDWIAGEVLPAIRKTGSYSIAPTVSNDVASLTASLSEFLPAIAGKVIALGATVDAQTARLDAVEQHQRDNDYRAIDTIRQALHRCKELLVFGTKGKPQAVTWRSYWQELKAHCKVGSFAIENQAALTVPIMEKAFAYATSWCETRGVKAPTLFEFSNEAAPDAKTA